MHVASQHIKRSACLPAALTLLMLFAGLVSPAQQQKNRLPDSVSTSVEELPPAVVDTVAVPSKDAGRRAGRGSGIDTIQNTDTAAVVEPVTLRRIPDTTLARLKGQKDFEYANDPAYWKEDPANARKPGKDDNRFLLFLVRLLSSKGFSYFIYLLMAGILIYALYRIIAENNLRVFYRKPAKLAAAGEGVAEWQEEDLEECLQRALQARDHRMATRYLYLKALRQLEAGQLIRYHIQATGQEYVQQMSGHPQGAAFRFLNAAYERVWYGEFPVDQQQFDKLYGYFQDFYKSTGFITT